MKVTLSTLIVINCILASVNLQKLCSDKPPNELDPKECCKLPTVYDSELDKICMTNYSKNTQRQLETMQSNNITMMPKGNCIVECIANQTKIYVGNGFIDRIKLTRLFLNAVSGDKEWGIIVSSSIDICMKEMNMKKEEMRQSALMPASFDGEVICHPISGYVFGCMNTELFKRCPNMTQSEGCEALRDYSESCHISVKI